MTDNDYNIIKPVESLTHIAGSAPVKQREKRKNRHNLPADHKQQRESTEEGLNEPVDSEDQTVQPTDDENDRHSIDYCA
jgi:hypothetical protein